MAVLAQKVVQHQCLHCKDEEAAHAATSAAFSAVPPVPPSDGPYVVAFNNKPESTQLGYCWTHGLTLNPAHNSRNCKRKAPNHQEDATVDNMMGGNNAIRRKIGERSIYKKISRDGASPSGRSATPALQPSNSTDSPSRPNTRSATRNNNASH